MASIYVKLGWGGSRESLFAFDCVHALLSVVAKTILVWLLVALALTVNIDILVDRGVR